MASARLDFDGVVAALQRTDASVTLNPERIKPSSDVALFVICAKHRGHKGKQTQAPKQVLGVDTLHAVCEERHVVVAEPSTHVVWTGPLPTRPFP